MSELDKNSTEYKLGVVVGYLKALRIHLYISGHSSQVAALDKLLQELEL